MVNCRVWVGECVFWNGFLKRYYKSVLCDEVVRSCIWWSYFIV